jgi:hypothetical protein
MKQRKMSPSEQIEKWSKEILFCRANGHSWIPHTARRITGGKGLRNRPLYDYYRETKVCARCPVIHVREMTVTGRVLSSGPRYPKSGYLSEAGPITGDDRDELRLRAMLANYQVTEIVSPDKDEAPPPAPIRRGRAAITSELARAQSPTPSNVRSISRARKAI